MDVRTEVRKAAIDAGINGVLEMAKKSGLSYPRTRRVWEGDMTAKVCDVVQVFNAMDLKLVAVKK